MQITDVFSTLEAPLIQRHLMNLYHCGVVIVDLDGTLADGQHRLNLLPTENQHLTETWLEFNAACVGDAPITDTIRIVNALCDSMYIVILTGRSNHVQAETLEWLEANEVEYDMLIMRDKADNRKDTVIKEDVLRAIGLDKIVAAYDDSPAVIAHMRSLGLTVYQVCDYGDNLHKRTDLHSHGVEKL